MDLTSNNLNIVSWNCRSLSANLSHFKEFLYCNKPHIVCLSETWLKPNKEPSFINYSAIWKHRVGDQRGGGVAILIRNDIHSVPKVLSTYNNSKLEVQSATLLINIHISIDFLNVYNPSEVIARDEYDFYFKQLNDNIVILGDFNSNHQMWDTRKQNNSAGNNLVDALLLHPSITLLTPPSLQTYHNVHTGNSSTLDLCFVSAHFFPIS